MSVVDREEPDTVAGAKEAGEKLTFIKAISAYRPRIKRGLMVDMDELVTFIAGRTGLNEGSILHVLMELRDSMAFFAHAGRSVRVRGLGIFGPNIDLQGLFDVYHKPDKWLRDELNKPNAFKGEVLNSDMIGKTFDDLIARWNEEHPDDPVK